MKLAWDYVGTEVENDAQVRARLRRLHGVRQDLGPAQQLSDYADPAKHPPGERAVIAAARTKSAARSSRDRGDRSDACPCIELKFTFAVTGNFGGVALGAFNAHIIGGRPGGTWATAQLSYNGIPLPRLRIAQARFAWSVRVSRSRDPIPSAAS